jgi:hypothetical protein
MSLWYFVSDWFAGVPTTGTLFKRSMINTAWAIAVILAMAVFRVPVEYAAAVFCDVFIVNGVMFVVYQRQRSTRRVD